MQITCKGEGITSLMVTAILKTAFVLNSPNQTDSGVCIITLENVSMHNPIHPIGNS